MKVIAFDLGKVLFDFDYAIALRKIEGKISISIEELLKQLYENRFGLDFEKGLISPEDFFLDFKNKFNTDFEYEYFVDLWCKIFFPKDDIISLAEKLKQKYPLYLISNINQLHFEYLLREYPDVFTIFEKLILSYEVKSIKPEKKIYDCLKSAAGVDFKQITYIDDRQDLIKEARILGLESIQFVNYHQLIRDLGHLGIEAGQ